MMCRINCEGGCPTCAPDDHFEHWWNELVELGQEYDPWDKATIKIGWMAAMEHYERMT